MRTRGVFWRKMGIAAALVVCGAVVQACNIPVFRYALERWQPDSSEIVIFHHGALTQDDEQRVQRLELASLAGKGVANAGIVRCDLTATQDSELRALWKSISNREEPELPCVLIRSKHGRNQIINHWQSPLRQATESELLESPVRSELIRRLQAGDAIVWLMLKSPDKDRNEQVRAMLTASCSSLPDKVELPEGVGLPGSELYSEVPLLLQFSVLEIDPADPKEQFLVRLLTGCQPEAAAGGDPLVAPVFGRGRVLEVIPAGQLDTGLIEDLTVFLCGACSCQVKEQNPGFDLLLATNWNSILFGEDSEGPPPAEATGQNKGKAPVLVPIPSGRERGESKSADSPEQR